MRIFKSRLFQALVGQYMLHRGVLLQPEMLSLRPGLGIKAFKTTFGGLEPLDLFLIFGCLTLVLEHLVVVLVLRGGGVVSLMSKSQDRALQMYNVAPHHASCL